MRMMAAMPEMTASEGELWRLALEERWGLHYSDTRLHQLSASLWRRMQQVGVDSFRDYYRLAVASATEWPSILEAVLNHESSFFRHAPSFEQLSRVVLPALSAEKKKQREAEISVWSAGCSTGQEAYSLAMTLLDSPDVALLRTTVLGSDISGKALAAARTAKYPARQMADVRDGLRGRYFRGTPDGQVQATAALRSMVEFAEFNLCDTATFGARRHDVIFCQNVLIYFAAQQRLRVVEALARQVKPGGYLFLAPGEVIGLRLDGFRDGRLSECLCFQRDPVT